MAQQYGTTPQVKTRTGLLVFLKGAATPVILYVENPQAVYEEIQQIIKTPTNALFEKSGNGPIKKFSMQASQIAAVALQDEQYV